MKGLGIIGCGGRMNLIAGKLLKITDQVRVTALCDPSEKSIGSAKKLFGSNPKVYENHRDLVKDPNVDWVAVGSWNCFHCEHIISALEAGKHVYTEKPMAMNLEECLTIKEALERSDRKMIIGFTLRYSPHYRKIREIVKRGDIGDIISFEFNETLEFNHGGYIHGDWRRLRKNAGTHILEKCCHDLDLANWITESIPLKVASFGGNDFFIPENEGHVQRLGKDKNGRDAYSTWPGTVEMNPFTSDKDITDNQVIIMEYANGVRATFHTNCNSGIPERRMYILGTEGAIRADVLTGRIETKRVGFNTQAVDESTGAKGGHGDGDGPLAESWRKAMLEDGSSETPFEDGLKSVVTANAIDTAMDECRVVNLSEMWSRTGIVTRVPLCP